MIVIVDVMSKTYLEYYLENLDYSNIPKYLIKYLKAPSLERLKKVGYFCGMDYASKKIYNFREYISRYDHSLTCSLLTYKLTKNKTYSIAALFHDIATPSFSHVIDYMNGDYELQESTEEYTENILKNDLYLLDCLKEDNINIEDIINFKNYSIVDNDRPKVCADRIDGVILTSIGWTKNITKNDITNILNDIVIYQNEDNEEEIGFKTLEIAHKVLEISKSIDIYCHSKEDNYMMQLLAKITAYAIEKKYISYDSLYTYDEEQIFKIFKNTNDSYLHELIYEFQNIELTEIPETSLPNVKIRKLNPIVNNKRCKGE